MVIEHSRDVETTLYNLVRDFFELKLRDMTNLEILVWDGELSNSRGGANARPSLWRTES